MSGVLLCGVAAGIDTETPIVFGTITGLTGFGAERAAVPNIHNGLTNNWGEMLLSCIKSLKPFRISFVHDTNATDFKTMIEAPMAEMAITWPVEKDYDTAAVTTFDAGVTDYTAGASDIQGRINAEVTITPSGEPTHTPGTPTA